MSLADALGSIKKAQAPETVPAVSTKVAKIPIAPRPSVTKALPGKTGKSSDPGYEPVKIFIRRTTHKAARRRWEDEERGDFSDLMEELLQRYLGA